MPQLFAVVAEKLSFKRREVGSATNPALANAHHLSPCSLNFARVRNDFGQLTGVLEDYQKSLALRHRLVRIDPSNAQWRYDEACILDQMGYEYRKAGFSHEAIAAYEVSAAIWRQLAKTDPLNRRLDLSISLRKLGDAKRAVADSVGATAAYEESAVNWRRLLKRDPDDPFLRINLVECLKKIGDLKFKAGDNTRALTAYREVVAIYRGLDEIDGSNTQRQWNLSLSLDRIGDVELALGHTDAAASAYEESLALRRRLLEADTSNSRWQYGISSSLKKISNFKHVAEETAAKLTVRRELQDIDRLIIEFNQIDAELQRSPSATEGKETTNVATRSLATIEESLTVSRGLATSDPTCAKYQCDLLADLEELAHFSIRHGDPVGALSAYADGLAIRRRLAGSDQNNEKLQRDLCITLERVGDLRQTEGDYAAAIALYEESLCIRRRLVAQDHGDTPGAPEAAQSLVPTPCTNLEESDVNRRRCATAKDQCDLVLTLKKVANARLNACDNPGALVALEESLATAHQLLGENKTSRINVALQSLVRSLWKIDAFLRLRFGRCRNEASALLEKFSASAWAAHGSHRAVKTVRLVTKRTVQRCRNEALTLLDKISARAWAAAQASHRAVKTVRLVTKRPLRRYRNEASALLDKISARLQAPARGSKRAAKTVTLVIKQLRLPRQTKTSTKSGHMSGVDPITGNGCNVCGSR